MADETVAEAKERIARERAVGVVCPCCTQLAKEYRRPLNLSMVRSLDRMVVLATNQWIHIPTAFSARSREEGKLAYWGLIEPSTEPREDGGRSGWWRVTEKGLRFAAGKETVPLYVHIYNGQLVRFSGPDVSIKDIYKGFDLRTIKG